MWSVNGLRRPFSPGYGGGVISPVAQRGAAPARRGRWVVLAALATTVGLLAVACGSTPPQVAARAPADLILPATDLPDGWAPTELSIPDLVAGNKPNIDEFARATIAPPFCRPTADAQLNGRLTPANSAVSAARSSSGTLVELVTTVGRDITADVATTTGRCARTQTVMGAGAMAGTRVDTEYTTLPDPEPTDRAVQQMVLTRSSGQTTLTDGAVSNRIGYAGYAIVDVPAGGTFTMQLTVSGAATSASNPPTPAVAPMDDATFVELFGSALQAATR